LANREHPLASQRIADIVRFDATTAQVFADLGIGPRYLFWTVKAAANAQGVDVEAVVRAVLQKFSRRRVAGATSKLAMGS
jgi:hypothetical protein